MSRIENKLLNFSRKFKTSYFTNIYRIFLSYLGDSSKSSERIKYDKSLIFSWDTCNDSGKLRILITTSGFAICFAGLGYRLIILANSKYVKTSSYHKIGSTRREIVDRNGILLAVNLPSSSLFANPQKIIDYPKTIAKLIEMWPNLEKKKLIADLKSEKSFVWIKRDITPKEYEQVFNLGLPGFDFEQEQKRVYTFGHLTSHIIGYVGREFSGLAGIEKRFEKFLSDLDSSQQIAKNKIEHNQPLELSIDIRLQSILSEEIDRTMNDFSAVGAVGIIADPRNGEILAMVSKPDFDPHQPYKASSEGLFNRASLGVYETGSVFKTLTMAIGFDVGAITIKDAYDVSYMKIGKFQVKDYHPHRGWQTVPEIFLHSSNIGVGQIILEIGKDNLKNYFKNLGLLNQLQIELPERGTPLYPSDARWSDLTLVTMSYGYGLSITPLHFVQAVLPAVNGGNFFPLTLIKRPENQQILSTKVFSDQTSDDMRKLLRLVVQEGTGKRAEVKGYLVGGKTGTTEKLLGKRYAKNSRVSSFLGVLPASNPKYVVYIMFDEPKGNKESFGFATAGFTAAPAVGRVFERMVALYGLESIDEKSPEAQKIINVNFKINDEI